MKYVDIEQIENHFPVEEGCKIILFSMTNCEPCKSVKDALSDVLMDTPFKINLIVTEFPEGNARCEELKRMHSVRFFPTLRLYLNGKVKGEIRGAISKSGEINYAYIYKWLDTKLGRDLLEQ